MSAAAKSSRRDGIEELDGAVREISAAIVAMQVVIGNQGAGATDEELEAVADPLRQALILAQIAREQAFPDATKEGAT